LWSARCQDNWHAGCGKRPGETDRPKGRNRAPGRLHHPRQLATAAGGTGSSHDIADACSTADVAHPSLTGMTTPQLRKLTHDLEALHHNGIQDRQRQRRITAGKKPHATRSGRPAQLAFADRVLATILHLRLSLPAESLAPVFASNPSIIRRAITETKQLLNQHGTTIEPITPSAPLAELLDKATKQPTSTRKIKPAS
jgi:hypothetical protein